MTGQEKVFQEKSFKGSVEQIVSQNHPEPIFKSVHNSLTQIIHDRELFVYIWVMQTKPLPDYFPIASTKAGSVSTRPGLTILRKATSSRARALLPARKLALARS